MSKDKPLPTTIKFSPKLQAKVEEAGRRMGLPKQEIIRLCTAIGLEDLRRINFDLASAVVDKAKPSETSHSHLRVAEDEAEYKKKRKS